jgi:hypothetical protein
MSKEPAPPPDPFAEVQKKILEMQTEGNKTLMNVPYYRESLVVFHNMGIVHLSMITTLTKVLTEIRDKMK